MRSIFSHLFGSFFVGAVAVNRMTTLEKFLSEFPDASPKIKSGRTGISAATVVRWQTWANTSERFDRERVGWLKGWHQQGRQYTGLEVHVPALVDLVTEEFTKHWSTEIQKIGGFGASKSKLEELPSMEVMATKNSPEMVSEVTEANLRKRLAHGEIRIIHVPNTSDCFAHYSWDDLTYLLNAGGSHNFAAAKYIAGKLEIPVPLRGKLYTYALNKDAVVELRRNYEVFVIRRGADYKFGFFKAMEAAGAAYFEQAMPMPLYHDVMAVFLPRTDEQSMRVADKLHAAGWTDLGDHLAELCINAYSM